LNEVNRQSRVAPQVRGDESPAHDLRPLFDPRSVAILGASSTPAKWGNWLARGALRGAHRRAVFLINRGGSEVLGQKTYRSLSELPEPVELVVIAIGAAGFEQAVDDSLHAGARAIVAITAGLGEMGGAGLAAERAVVERVRAAGAVLVGPNCLGVIDTQSELDLAYADFVPGPIGLISQSGNLALELALVATDAGLGFSRFVSVGNQADLEVTELIQMFEVHEPTRVIAVYVEDFRDGRAFAEAASGAHAAHKPVILLTAGSSRAGARAALSHTGALVSASVAIDAACHASGMLRVTSPRQMIDLAQGLLMPHAPRGRRVGVVGDGGGHVALAADLLTEGGLELPGLSDALASQIAAALPATAATRNPVDMAGGGEQDLANYERAVRSLAGSGEVDAVLLTGYFGGYSQESGELARMETDVALAMAGAAEAAGRPLIAHTMYPHSPPAEALRSRQVPVYDDIAGAARMLARIVEWRGQTPTGVPTLPDQATHQLIQQGYFEARELLSGVGIPFVEAHRVTTLAEAQSAARELSFPVVLKALVSSHKSDAGGVRLGIAGEGELEAVFTDMVSRLKPAAFSVERMVDSTGAVELLVGVRRDPSFGPIVVIGMGGLYAELLEDLAVALAPLAHEEAEQLVKSLRAAPLLTGARGRPPLNVAGAALVAVHLSKLAAARGDLAEVEINPLLVRRTEVIALDARVVPL
jgi:acyl-CoA synthetase (NDP forming)